MWFMAVLACVMFALWYVLTLLVPSWAGVMPDLSAIHVLLNFGFYFIPLSSFLTCMAVIMAVWEFEFFISGMNWIIRKIPTIS